MIFINTIPNRYNLTLKKYLINIYKTTNNYLTITLLQDLYASGISSFLLFINLNMFKHNSYILLLCLDLNGLYVLIYDTLFILNNYHRIAIRIKSENINGKATLYIAGITKGNSLYNFLYTDLFFINKHNNNVSTVRYQHQPKLYCSRQDYYENLVSGLLEQHLINIISSYYLPALKKIICKIEPISSYDVSKSYFINLNNNLLFGLRNNILFANNTTIKLLPLYSDSICKSLLNKTINTSMFINNKILLEQLKKQSLLSFRITDIKPVCGYIDALNIFYRNKSAVGLLEYVYLSNVKILNKQLLAFNKKNQKSAGQFVLNTVLLYWITNDLQSLSLDSDYLMNGLKISKVLKLIIFTLNFVLANTLHIILIDLQSLIGTSALVIGNDNDIILRYKDNLVLEPYHKYLIKFRYVNLLLDNTMTVLLRTNSGLNNLVTEIVNTSVGKLLKYTIKFSPEYLKYKDLSYLLRFIFNQLSVHIISDIVVQLIHLNDLNVNYFLFAIATPLLFKSEQIDIKLLLLDKNNKRCYDYLYYNNVDIIGAGFLTLLTLISGWQLDNTSLYTDKIKIDSNKKGIIISDLIKLRVFLQQRDSIIGAQPIKVTFPNADLQDIKEDTYIPNSFTFYSSGSEIVDLLILNNITKVVNKQTVKLIYDEK